MSKAKPIEAIVQINHWTDVKACAAGGSGFSAVGWGENGGIGLCGGAGGESDVQGGLHGEHGARGGGADRV